MTHRRGLHHTNTLKGSSVGTCPTHLNDSERCLRLEASRVFMMWVEDDEVVG